ncbi:MAG: hypothetical protein HC822_11600 [Oscillochloris sp.]|nr:hypothetical protein [Oscillochloris sp.]
MAVATDRAPRQRLGRRLDVKPYYRVVEQTPGKVRLESYEEANRKPGISRLVLGLVMIGIGMGIVVSGSLAGIGGAGFGVAAISAVIGGLLVSFGFQRAAGGYAVLTTRNAIEIDAGEVRYIQHNRLAGERRQVLPRAQISGLQVRRRPLAVGSVIKQIKPIAVLELVAGDTSWIVDSAADGADLRAAAQALAEILGMDLRQ